MSKPQNTTSPAKSKTPLLSSHEVDRLAELLGAELEWDSSRISRFMLLVNHLESVREDFLEFDLAIFSIKQKMFSGTSESSDAQQAFETKVRQERGKLLRWPKAVK